MTSSGKLRTGVLVEYESHETCVLEDLDDMSQAASIAVQMGPHCHCSIRAPVHIQGHCSIRACPICLANVDKVNITFLAVRRWRFDDMDEATPVMRKRIMIVIYSPRCNSDM